MKMLLKFNSFEEMKSFRLPSGNETTRQKKREEFEALLEEIRRSNHMENNQLEQHAKINGRQSKK